MTAAVLNKCFRKSISHLLPSRINNRNYTRLAEVGRLETPKGSKYETGQMFLHRVFGYRGVTLFPRTARLYDRDQSASETSTETESNQSNAFVHPRVVSGVPQNYYLVLIDSRDCPFVRTQTEAVTFLGTHEDSKSLYAVPGLDYVSHEDILPYTATKEQLIHHGLFDKFLQPDPNKDPPFRPREALRMWQDKNHSWLEMNQVHRETTEDVRVTVIPFYMGCRSSHDLVIYWWRYCVRIENLGDKAVQLRERSWRIFSQSGNLETVNGRGVVGQEPILSKSLPAFQYSSQVSLQASSGHMWGTFRMEREDGHKFECRIPPFSLESKSE